MVQATTEQFLTLGFTNSVGANLRQRLIALLTINITHYAPYAFQRPQS
jgi:hypothetical protein